MGKQFTRRVRRLKVRRKIRSKIRGTEERPRLCVFRSLRHIYAQLVADDQEKVIAGVSTLKIDGKKLKNSNNMEAAKKAGQAIAQKALESGVKKVVFDRSGYLYHGRVKALAEAAREAGLQF